MMMKQMEFEYEYEEKYSFILSILKEYILYGTMTRERIELMSSFILRLTEYEQESLKNIIICTYINNGKKLFDKQYGYVEIDKIKLCVEEFLKLIEKIKKGK